MGRGGDGGREGGREGGERRGKSQVGRKVDWQFLKHRGGEVLNYSIDCQTTWSHSTSQRKLILDGTIAFNYSTAILVQCGSHYLLFHTGSENIPPWAEAKTDSSKRRLSLHPVISCTTRDIGILHHVLVKAKRSPHEPAHCRPHVPSYQLPWKITKMPCCCQYLTLLSLLQMLPSPSVTLASMPQMSC